LRGTCVRKVRKEGYSNLRQLSRLRLKAGDAQEQGAEKILVKLAD
jgi:hypothetical protein